MDGYAAMTGSELSRLYFISFYFIATVFVLNLVVVVILDAAMAIIEMDTPIIPAPDQLADVDDDDDARFDADEASAREDDALDDESKLSKMVEGSNQGKDDFVADEDTTKGRAQRAILDMKSKLDAIAKHAADGSEEEEEEDAGGGPLRHGGPPLRSRVPEERRRRVEEEHLRPVAREAHGRDQHHGEPHTDEAAIAGGGDAHAGRVEGEHQGETATTAARSGRRGGVLIDIIHPPQRRAVASEPSVEMARDGPRVRTFRSETASMEGSRGSPPPPPPPRRSAPARRFCFWEMPNLARFAGRDDFTG